MSGRISAPMFHVVVSSMNNLLDKPGLVGTAALNQRQNGILEQARAAGEVQVESLSESLDVTPQTIRRDLNLMCDMRLLQRIHGGAVLHDGVTNLGYGARKRFMFEEKAKIGEAAASLIADDSSIFVNIGTTVEGAVQALHEHRGLLVVTNNVNVVEMLRYNESMTIMMAGGKVRSEDGGIIGKETVEFISQFKMDKAIIGVSAIDQDGTLLDYDQQEVSVAKAIIANSRSTILVADSNKFERNAPMRIGNVAEVDYLVTDKTPSRSFMDVCKKHSVEIVIAK